MAIVMYPAVIERTGAGFAVFFPDLACGGAGDTLEQAVADAEQGLSAYLDAAHQNGLKIPAPTPIDKLDVDDDIDEVARVLVRYEPPAHAVRINITMDQALLKRVDAVAEREGFTRSGFLADAARRRLVEERRGISPGIIKKGGAAKAMGRDARTGAFMPGTKGKSGPRAGAKGLKRSSKR